MLGLGITRLEAELAGVLIIIAAALMWLGFHDAAIKRAAIAPVIAKVQEAEQAASVAATIKAAQVTAEQQGNLHEATAQNAARVAVARDLAAVVRGLHDDAIRPVSSARDSGASGGGGGLGVPAPDVVPGPLYRAALGALADTASDAQDLAGYAECLRIGGTLCQRDYEALKP